MGRRRALCLLALSLCALPLQAQSQAPEVMLFGVFHFANPGRDVVRVDQADISTPANQAYLERLARRICAFRPTAILLEFDRTAEPEMRRQFEEYASGRSGLPGVNENYQIGFRVARTCGVRHIHGFDETEVGWDSAPLFAYLEHSAPELRARFDAEITRIGRAEAAAHRKLGLRELLIRANDPEQDRQNKDLYLLTNAAGAGAGFEGADAAASWWRRNFRMYANIQRYATAGERILVVAGSGHTAILRDLLAIDRRIRSRDVRACL